jgi:hypothetical protein
LVYTDGIIPSVYTDWITEERYRIKKKSGDVDVTVFAGDFTDGINEGFKPWFCLWAILTILEVELGSL